MQDSNEKFPVENVAIDDSVINDLEKKNLAIKNLEQHIENFVNFHPHYEPKEFLLRMVEVTIPYYLARFVKYLSLELEDIICIGIYFDRFLIKKPTITINNIYIILAAIIVIEQKFQDDNKICRMEYYAKLAGLTAKALKDIEREILTSWLPFNLIISPEEYADYELKLSNPTGLGWSLPPLTTTLHHIDQKLSIENYVVMAESLRLNFQYSRIHVLFNHAGIQNREALLVAALEKRLNFIALLILKGSVKVDFIITNKGMHLFTWVICLGFSDVASQILNKLVLEEKTDIALKLIKNTQKYITPAIRNALFFESICNSQEQFALTWLEEGADPDYYKSTSAFNLAIENDLLSLVAAMLKMDLTKETYQKAVFLIVNHSGSKNASILDHILQNTSELYLELWNLKNAYQSTILHMAIINGKPLKTIVLLCNRGLSINHKNILGDTPLETAITMQSTDTVRAILHNNYEPFMKDEVLWLGEKITRNCDISLLVDLLHKAQRDNPELRTNLKPIPYFTQKRLSWEQFDGVLEFFKSKTTLVKLIKKQVSLMPIKDEELKSLILAEALACCDYLIDAETETGFGNHKRGDSLLFLRRLLCENTPRFQAEVKLEAQHYSRGEKKYSHWFWKASDTEKIARETYMLEHVRSFQSSTSGEKKTSAPSASFHVF